MFILEIISVIYSFRRAMSEEATNGKVSPSPSPQPTQSAPTVEMAQMAINESSKITFLDQFRAFSKFGDTKSDGKHITLSQSDKWMKQAKVIDKKITTTDTGIHFKKFKALKISYGDYNKFLDDLAKTRKVDLEEIKKKMINCGSPGVTQVTVSEHVKQGNSFYCKIYMIIHRPAKQLPLLNV